MLPLTLTVHNFLCYAEDAPLLDLRDVRLACLSGQNGHGKSALLDAVTWALWGSARGKTQEELVHQGATEMRVELEFQARGGQYRIIRRYRAKGSRSSAQSSLELASWDGSRYVAVSGDGVRGTEEKIQTLLGMDYNTFVNSAFLLQGHSDAFTSAPPRDRKEVLARILELDVYDHVSDRARKESTILHGEALVLEREIDRLVAEAKREGELLMRMGPTMAIIAGHRQSLLDATKRLQDERRKAEDLRRARDEAKAIEERLPGISQALLDLTAQRQAARRRVTAHQELLARRDAILQGRAALDTARKEMTRLEALRQEHQTLVTKRAPLEQAIAEAKAALEQEGKGLRTRVDKDLAPLAKLLPVLEHQAMTAEMSLADLQRQERALTEKRSALEKQVHEQTEAFSKLREREESFARAGRSLAELQQRAAPLERAVAEARARLETQRDVATRRIAELESVAKTAVQHKSAAEAALKALLELESAQRIEIEARTAKAQTFRSAIERAEAEKKTLTDASEELWGRVAVLNGAKEHGHAGATCPLCESALGEDGVARLRARFGVEEKDLSSRKRAADAAGKQAKTALAALENEAAAFQSAQALALTQARQHADAARKVSDNALTAAQELITLREQAKTVVDKLWQQDFAPQEQQHLAQMKSQIQAIHYDQAQHQAVREELVKAQQVLEPLQATLTRELPRQEQTLAKQMRETSTSLQGLGNDMANARKAAVELEAANERLTTLRRAFQAQEYAHEARAALTSLDEAITALGYDAAAHDAVRQALEHNASFDLEANRLAQAEAELPGDEESLKQLESLMARQMEQSHAERERLDLLTKQVADLPTAEMAWRSAETQLTEHEEELRQAEKIVATLDAELARARKSGEEAETTRKRLAEAREEQSLYDELARAFGRNGVQLMVIQRMLPEIEEEANLLLSKMTDGRMNVRLQLERRGTEEQLTILIADELGTRAYEMFSGGEAFRVDLAVRIALARVLTRRSGAPLPTLFIDEGFGTQDSAGLDNIVDVLRSIRDDFQQIIVVTHLDSLKDQFPVRIEVVKRDAGSTFSMTWNE